MNALTKNNGGLGLNFEVPNFYENLNFRDSTEIDWNSQKWVAFQTQVCGQANAPGCEMKFLGGLGGFWQDPISTALDWGQDLVEKVAREDCSRRGEWNTCNDLSRIVWMARMAVVKASQKELDFFKEREKEVANATVQKTIDNAPIRNGTTEINAPASTALNWILGLALLGGVVFVGYKIVKKNQTPKEEEINGLGNIKKPKKPKKRKKNS
jgi:hypothetical protein